MAAGRKDSGHMWVLKPIGLASKLDVRGRSIKDDPGLSRAGEQEDQQRHWLERENQLFCFGAHCSDSLSLIQEPAPCREVD